MADYRVYCLDGQGQIGLADWIEAQSDDEALARARALRPDAHKCEVWLKNRLVAKLNAGGRLEEPSNRRPLRMYDGLRQPALSKSAQFLSATADPNSSARRS